MEGGKEMIPQTTHLTHFYANTAAGSASDVSPDTLLHKYCGRWAGNVASDRPPDTTNTAAGGALNVLPDALSQQYLAKWERNVASDRPPDSLFRQYLGR